jgi:GWxTD domain-containing protein
MCNESRRFAILLAVALLTPGLAAAQKLDKDDKKWLDEVRPIMLQDEEKTYKALKEKADRLEFRKIFWARRDADLATPESEFQAEYLNARAAADTKFRTSVQIGSNTDCGRTFILLGKADECGRSRPARPASWPRRPGRTTSGPASRARQSSRSTPTAAPGGFSAQLERLAAVKVLHPNIDYRTEARTGGS